MTIITMALCAEDLYKEDLRPALRQVLQPYGGINFFVEPGGKPLIYLGQIWPAPPEMGLNPQPALLKALAELAREAGAVELTVAARPAPGFAWADALQLSCYAELAAQGISFRNLAEAPGHARESSLNLALKQLDVPDLLFQGSCLINVSKFRTAESMLFGAALLNLQAATELPAGDEHSARALVDLHSIVQPDLHLVDCTCGTQGFQPQMRDALLAGLDAVALDLVLSALAGVEAASLDYLTLAAQYGLGSAQAGDIHLVGEGLEDLFGVELAKNEDEE